MKKTILILMIISLFVLMASANATHINAQVQDKYLINETQQLQSTIKIQKPTEDYIIHSYIDGRDIEKEANSGGYIDGTDEYLLPSDLGYGLHNICFKMTDKYNNKICEENYQFHITKYADEDTSKYDEYTPYYYEEGYGYDEKMLEEDWEAFNFLNGLSIIQDNNEKNFNMDFTDYGVKDCFMEKVNVKIDLGVYGYDDSLTMAEPIMLC